MYRLVSLCVLIASLSGAHAGTADWYQIDEMLVPSGDDDNRIGYLGFALAAFDAHLAAVGHYSDNNVAGYVFRHENGSWVAESPLIAETGQHWFTSTVRVAGDGDIIAVGDRRANTNQLHAGAVWVFHRDSDLNTWPEQVRLVSKQKGEEFGTDVAVQGKTLAVGARAGMQLGFYSGAVHIFEFKEGTWSETQVLVDPDAEFLASFGWAVEFEGDYLYVGAPRGRESAQRGKVIVFKRSPDGWQYDSKIVASDAYPGDRFGSAIAAHGDMVAVGAPLWEDELTANVGAVYVFQRSDDHKWEERTRLAPPVRSPQSEAGESIAMNDSTLLISAPGDSVYNGPAFVYARNNDQWSRQTQLCLNTGDGLGDLGGPVALHNDQFLVGAPWYDRPGAGFGAVAAFELAPVQDDDCNDNGIPDACEPNDDCNDNGINDICEIADGGLGDCDGDLIPDVCEIELISGKNDCNDNGIPDSFELLQHDTTDCNANGVPDECEQSTIEDCNNNEVADSCENADYHLNNRNFTDVLGWTPGDEGIWLNRFTAKSGAEYINSVSVALIWTASDSTSIDIVIYNDKDNDGSPAGERLIRQVTVQPNETYYAWARFDIPPTYVGPAGNSFFVGIVHRDDQSSFFAIIDQRRPLERRSWHGRTRNGNSIQIDPLGGFVAGALSPMDERTPFWYNAGSWLLRADGTHFEGVPTECACPADIAAPLNQTVDELDLMALIDNWGDCAAPCAPFCDGDVSGPAGLPDCTVNVHDLLALLADWGACPTN